MAKPRGCPCKQISVGTKQNMLTTVSPVFKRGNKFWVLCLCECGKKKEIRSDVFRRGSKSCGCFKPTIPPRYTHRKSRTKMYQVYMSILARCTNENDRAYRWYGGRGITICERWLDFLKFYEDMGDAPPHCSLDRIDCNLGYSKENCRWVTHEVQTRNIRKQCNNTSGYTGVFYRKDTNKFAVYIRAGGKRLCRGNFTKFDDAVNARIESEIELWGECYSKKYSSTEP